MSKRRRLSANRKRILISCETIYPNGDVESGWVDKEGYEVGDVSEAVRVLSQEGPLESSSTHFHKGVWYTQSDGHIDYSTGVEQRNSYHLKDFSEGEERRIFKAMSR